MSLVVKSFFLSLQEIFPVLVTDVHSCVSVDGLSILAAEMFADAPAKFLILRQPKDGYTFPCHSAFPIESVPVPSSANLALCSATASAFAASSFPEDAACLMLSMYSS